MKINRIQSNLKIHDRYNLELKISYLLDKNKRINEYQIENYIFLPNNLGVNAESYPRELFYQRLQNYVRFKTPSIPLDKITDDLPNSPLRQVLVAIKTLHTQSVDQEKVQVFEHEIKMFGAIARGALSDFIAFLKDSASTPEDKRRLAENFLTGCSELLDTLHVLWEKVCQPSIPLDSQKSFLHMDEAIRLSIDDNAFRLVQLIKTGGGFCKAKDEVDVLCAPILVLIRRNQERREKLHGEPPPSFEGTNENYIFRKRILKKFLSSVLFLEVTRRKEKERYEHILFGLAAGIAMAFTIVVAYYFNRRFEIYSVPVIAAAIIGYMMKDRLKAVFQSIFSRLLDRHLYDHRINIHLPQPRRDIGYCQEYVRYMKEDDLPERIAFLRNQKSFQRLERELIGESILLYRKKIALYSRPIRQRYPKVFGINDIIRINVRVWLAKMDNARTPLYVLNEEGYTKTFAKKVYHIHFVSRFKTADSETFSLFKIIINQKGLERIEEIPLSVGS